MSVPRERRGGVILCGGKSSRMGQDKASLEFGSETLLQRTVRRLSNCIPLTGITCVAACRQPLPDLPKGVTVVRDLQPGQGPLAAVAWGMRAAADVYDAALVVGCDHPMLSAQFIELLFAQLAEADFVAGRVEGQERPLPAVMRIDAAGRAESLLDDGERSLKSLTRRLECRWLDEATLRRADPELRSLVNCNTAADYQHALELAGLAQP